MPSSSSEGSSRFSGSSFSSLSVFLILSSFGISSCLTAAELEVSELEQDPHSPMIIFSEFCSNVTSQHFDIHLGQGKFTCTNLRPPPGWLPRYPTHAAVFLKLMMQCTLR